MQLGAPVTVSAIYKRRRRFGQNFDEKYWDVRNIKPRSGLYIGARTLSNGVTWFEHEVGNVYEPKEYLKAALVVFSTHEAPVFVPMDALAHAGVGDD